MPRPEAVLGELAGGPAAGVRRMRAVLGTFVEIGASADPADTAGTAVDAAFAALEALQRQLGFQRADSELSRLNAQPGKWHALSPSTLRVLALARSMTVASRGCFDCTVGGELVALGVLPDHGGIVPLRRGRASDIELGRGAARLVRPIRVTLDGIAKGFAVDRAVAVLKRRGVASGWVNAGGDLRVFGGQRLPVAQRRPDGTLQSLGLLGNGALASSRAGGAPDPDRPGFLVATGGAPAAAEARVVSVVCRFAWRADALTKVAGNTPQTESARAVARLGGCLVEGPSCAA